MAQAVAHRGPDGEGIWVDASTGLALSHRRLAIIDRSDAGRQPMTSRDGRWTIVLNGEIYGHGALRTELGSRGVVFRGRSDTESLVEALAMWGVEASLERTGGMFALAAWDSVERRLVLARDRLGEKPLYWRATSDQMDFASELRSLRAVADAPLGIDDRSAIALLHRSFVPHPHTIHAGVRQVPPGGLVEVTWHDGTIATTERSWWSIGDSLSRSLERRTPIGIDEAADQVDAVLADSVAQRLESDVGVGAFLSGGIDSSLVAHYASRALGGSGLSTFTIAMPDIGLDESQHAARVAAHIGTDHTTVDLSLAEALAMIPRLPTIWDEPFADPSMLPTALLTASVRTGLAVCLSGDGGDELFAGYNRHAVGARLGRRLARMPGPVRRSAGSLVRRVPTSVYDTAGRVIPAARRPPRLGDKAHKVGALLRSPDSAWDVLAETWSLEDLGVAGAHRAARPAVQGTSRNPLDEVDAMLLADTASVLPDEMLVKVDRASMAVGLEVRVPLLDHRLLELAWSLPTDLKASGGTGKIVLRHLARRHLPADLVDRPKQGFDPPLATWLRTDLSDWAGDLLSRPQSVERGWISGAAVRRSWADHRSGARNEEYRLWAVLMLEAWLLEQQS